EYYACATGEAAPKPKASARKKKGGSASSTPPRTPVATPTPTTTVVAAPRLSATAKGKQPVRATTHTEPTDVERTKAEQLKIVLKRSRQETHISQQRGSGTDKGTDVDEQTKGREESEGDKTDESDDGSNDGNDDDNDETVKAGSESDEDDDDNDDEEELAKNDDEDTESGKGGDEVSEREGESDEEETRQEEDESFDLIPRAPEGSEDEGSDEEDQELRLSEEARIQEEEEEADELYRDVNINQGRGLQVTQNIEDSHVTLTLVHPDGPQESSSMSSFMTSMLNPISDAGVESIFTTASSSIVSLQTPTPIMTPSTIATITTSRDAPIPPTTIPSIILENLPTFNSAFRFDERLRSLETQNLPTFDSVFRFEDRLKSLEVNFTEFIQTNQFAEAVSNISGIVHQYMNQQMTEAVREAVQIQTDRLRDSYQRENDQFLRTIDDNIKRIIKEQVKSQVKEQVLRILPRIEESVNAQLKAEVLTRSSHSSQTSYAVAADLSEMELKQILIKKMEGNKSIQRSDEQRNLYKALVDAYEADKTILDSYGETAILKRRREDDDDQEGPSAGSNQGSKRRREGGEPESARALLEPATRSADRSTTGSKPRQASASESAFAEEPVQTTSQVEVPSHSVFETGAEDQHIVQTSQHPEWFPQPKKPPTPDHTPLDFSDFIMNRLGVDTLTLELLAGPTYELMRGSCNTLTEPEYHLEEPLPLIPNNRGRRVIPFAHFINNDLEYLQGGASSRKYTTFVTKTKAADYRHIKWIEDLVPRAMWIQEPINYDRHALWGVSYWGRKRQQFYRFAVNRESALDKRLNLTKPDTYRPDLKRREAYTAYLNPIGFIHQNKDKKNRLMQIDELYKFSDGTLNDVRNALDDRLKGIRMQYLPTTIWRRGNKDRAMAMIQAIDKTLKTRRIMRSFEKFVGERLMAIAYQKDQPCT
nr:hypothetical protein [Tanacetum cinerariifolium]